MVPWLILSEPLGLGMISPIFPSSPITHRFFQELKPGFISHDSFLIALQDEEL
ncbi:hypothetical protein F5Y10DRAFT_259711 [Nemania abortiva]|nr:hypothetical protein F5Y10DRAFT_259711 [Nemania abortiva]